MEKNKIPPVKVNEVLKLVVTKFGSNGDPMFVYKDFVIFLKGKRTISVNVNEIVEVRITKMLPKFATAEKTKNNS